MGIGVLALIWLILGASAFAGLMVLGLAAKIMDVSGASVALTSAVLAGVALANTSGRLSAALFGVQRSSAVRALLVSCSLTLAGILVAGLSSVLSSNSGGSLIPGLWLGPEMGLGLGLGLGLILIAGGYGLTASAIPLLTAQHSTPALFQRQYGLIFTAWGVAGFIAPWLAGRLFDLRGDFQLAFAVAALTTLGSVALILLFRRRLRPDAALS